MSMDLFSLAGKTAVVTGASRGLGAGMALGLAEAGADLVVVASGPRIDETRERVMTLGRACVAVRADLSEPEAIPAVMDCALSAFGKVDILLNCAGIIRRAPAIEFTAQDWDDVVNLNQRALFFLCQAAARDMMQRGRGKIINIASMLSFQGGVIVPSYTASKSAVVGITKALANEWALHGINVNAIAPGYMATELTEALQKNPERGPAILARIPQGRWGTPDDLKGAAVYLASAASDYVQGHVLVVDGGWLAR